MALITVEPPARWLFTQADSPRADVATIDIPDFAERAIGQHPVQAFPE
jgi:hypothetical protein